VAEAGGDYVDRDARQEQGCGVQVTQVVQPGVGELSGRVRHGVRTIVHSSPHPAPDRGNNLDLRNAYSHVLGVKRSIGSGCSARRMPCRP
jgi:hypothetical protein